MNRPVALVYRGPASVEGCPEAVAGLLAESRWGFDVRYVGPGERIRLGQSSLDTATLYAQPGGGTLKKAFNHLRGNRDEVRSFVRHGGRYLGFCLGGYLAGATPGFDLLPGDTDQYIGSADAELATGGNALVDVRWRNRRQTMFFQDGPHFWLNRGAEADIVATYRNGLIAAMTVPFGAGRVGVAGPHPEATEDWFADAGLSVPAPSRAAAHELVDAVMASVR
ncbi:MULTISPECIES: BPL-N domain-containing protein [Amycolatopsis]|uniref:BPL-N domain-containing protein n=1 Tax=Amycolatopsis albidoflavus TaxID=102226 RepID=A0ABW5HRQ2_9PSEU